MSPPESSVTPILPAFIGCLVRALPLCVPPLGAVASTAASCACLALAALAPHCTTLVGIPSFRQAAVVKDDVIAVQEVGGRQCSSPKPKLKLFAIVLIPCCNLAGAGT